MADGVTYQTSTLATPASGTEVATDDCGAAGHAQLVKLAYSADGDATPITADGNGLEVQLGAAIPAGTNAIGKLAANSGVDIGDVDVTSVPADPFGANADAASATGSISAKLRFIASTGIPITGTVTVGSHAVTNAGTFVVQENGAALTALQLIDNCIYVDDADWTDNTSSHALVGGVYQSSPHTVTDGDVTPFLTDANGRLAVSIASTSTVTVTQTDPESLIAGVVGTVNHDSAISTNNPVRVGGYASAAAPSSVNADGDAVAGWFLRNGAQATVLTAAGALIGGDATNGLDVDVTRVSGSVTITQTDPESLIAGVVGVFTHDGTISTNTPVLVGGYASAAAPSGVSGDGDAVAGWFLRNGAQATVITAAGALIGGDATGGLHVQGAIAHDSADSGAPNKIGAKAIASQSGVTLVTANDRTNLYAGLDGILLTRPHTNLESIVSGNASNTDGSSTQCIATAGAGVKQYLTSVMLTNTSASNIYVELKSGTTVKATIPLPAAGGAIVNFTVPLPPNAADEAWNFDPSAAASTVYCSMVGFTSKI